MAKVLTVKEAAIEIGTDPRTLRKFLRSDASPVPPVGKGSRYAIEGKAMRSVKAKFAAWDAARTPTKGDDEVTEGDAIDA